MPELELVTHSIEVPKNTGAEGFLHTIRELLKLSRIQSIAIDAKGKVTYKRYVEEGSRDKIGMDFTGVEPWHIARNAPDGVEELILPQSVSAAVVLTQMLDRATMEKLYPTAFVTGSDTVLWHWYRHTTSYALSSRTELCGLPLYLDRHFPDTSLVLCASFAKDGALVDTQKAYKAEMEYRLVPATEVEVFDD